MVQMRKKDLSGAVSSIKSDDLMLGNPTSISQALQGKLAGVQVNQSDGAPGSGVSITIVVPTHFLQIHNHFTLSTAFRLK